MMSDPINVCVSLDTAKKLVEAGLNIPSLFWWVKSCYDPEPELIPDDIYSRHTTVHRGKPSVGVIYLDDVNWDYEPIDEAYPAPTASELVSYRGISECLESIMFSVGYEGLQMKPHIREWQCRYHTDYNTMYIAGGPSSILHEAIANGILWLLKKGKIKVKDNE